MKSAIQRKKNPLSQPSAPPKYVLTLANAVAAMPNGWYAGADKRVPQSHSAAPSAQAHTEVAAPAAALDPVPPGNASASSPRTPAVTNRREPARAVVSWWTLAAKASRSVRNRPARRAITIGG